jgi:hemoglobin/transferrin/lactoferrin receptor protein
MSRTSLAALLLGTAVFPAFAVAQTIVLESIILNADPLSTSQVGVTEDQINDARNGTLKDVFRAEPSVIVGGGMAITERVFVNGIDQQQLSVTVDGAAQNNRMFHHTGTNIIDPNLLKAVTVDAGVAPADAGFGALAGSIAYETKSALDLLEDGQTFGGVVTTGYASNGGTAEGALTLYGRQGPVDAMLYVKRVTGDDYEDGAGDDVDYSGADLDSYALKLGAEMGDWRAEFGLTQVVDDALRPYRANLGGVEGRTNEARRYSLKQTTQTLNLRRLTADGLFDPEFIVTQSNSDLDTYDLNDDGSYSSNYNEGDADTFTIKAQNHFALGMMDVTAGVEHSRSKAIYEGIYNDYYGYYREDVTNTGTYAQARGTYQRFDYSAGVRYDVSRFTGAGGQSVDTEGASANASVTWHATDALKFDAGYSTVFGGTPLAAVYDLYDAYEADDAYDDLTHSRAHNTILGVEWTTGNTTLGGELFRTRLNNTRKKLVTHDVDSEGFRLSARQDWQGGYATLRYSDTDVEVDGGAATTYELLDLGTIPGRILTLEARHEVMSGLELGGVIQHTLDEEATGSDATSDWPSYTVVDVFAEYEPAKYDNVTVRAEVNNLFDRDYIDRASYGGDYAEVYGQKEAGRSIGLSLSVSF